MMFHIVVRCRPFIVAMILIYASFQVSLFNHKIHSVQKMVRQTLKMLQQMLQDF